ncbi:uncharacterized protein LOC113498870 isoform X2 [Trichoplusia ni]|uniref:Uncharacterized protein LOC113498870 isoform X2 n=1 Tax=Trichoplusia ni TaxID=7111 RepID=A0A7E5W2J6_TRINI|nr:uncharacterized protein LOC113498870 isoform X2 [Trichoplusia ni]
MMDLFLEIINNARSRVATGVEKGNDGKLLPRGYGIMRLKWDRELATFAQILANQCFLGKGDECRATNQFSNPSQSISMLNFFDHGWLYSSNVNETDAGLTEKKIMNGIRQSLNSWVPEDKTVTKDMILNYPGSEELSAVDRLFLNAVRGGSTHMGCGISAFTRYNTADNTRQDVVNVLQIICNFADSPQVSQPVYMTDPPIPGTGFTDQCGCPIGYKESDGCLCVEDPDSHNKILLPNIDDDEKATLFTEKPAALLKDDHTHATKAEKAEHFKAHEYKYKPVQTRFVKKKSEEKKQVAFLPIFKIEPAPSELVERTYNNALPPILRYDNLTFIPRNEGGENSNEKHEKVKSKSSKKYSKNRFYYVKNQDSNKVDDEEVSVVRRSLGKQLKQDESDENSFEATDKHKTFNTDDNTDEDSEQYPRRRNEYNSDKVRINPIKHLTDDNLMSLLDILERKVSNIDMDYKAKEIFDAKMRKIYKNVWNKHKQMQRAKRLPQLKQKPGALDIEDEFRELKNLLKLKSEHIFDHEHFHNTRRFGGNDNRVKNENKVIKFSRENNHIQEQHKKKIDTSRNDMIDDKLLEILSHKYNQLVSDSDLKLNGEINGRQTYMDRQLKDIHSHKSDAAILTNDFEHIDDYDEENDSDNIPIPRNQETFNKYDRRSDTEASETNDRKVVKFNHLNDLSDGEYSQKVLHTPKLVKDNIIEDRHESVTHRANKKRTPARKRFSYFEEPEETQDTRPFRRISDYNFERPHRRLQFNQINTPWKAKIQRITNPYFLSDRATY